jgi:predicted metalloprotease
VKLDDVDEGGFHVEDRRGRGGGLSGLPLGRAGKLGIPGLIVVVVAFLLTRGGGGSFDPGAVLGELGGGTATASSLPQGSADTMDEQERFVAQVGTLLEAYWRSSFEGSGTAFRPASAVVFDGPTDTGGCGVGTPQAGPFYCPASQQIFIDFAFYEQLERQLGFQGDFAMAYVLAHEYGHHVQNLLGIDEKVRKEQDGASQADANELSVQLELQADCFAGVWAKSADQAGRLEKGDIDEAIDAAQAVGDDAIQRKTQGSVDRDTFTHGSSADRKRWFTTGYDSGSADSCDTFG